MEYKDILDRLSPCGIRCDTCFAFKEGHIHSLSRQLSEHLGNFQNYAPRFSEVLNEPVFNIYPYFKLQLDYFREVSCKGCRHEKCKLMKTCKVRLCIEKKGVDFCFECSEFPCKTTGLDENLESRWENNNRKMKALGVKDYFAGIQGNHRYS